jgi:hypothetical protein
VAPARQVRGRPCRHIRNELVDDLVASGLKPLPVPVQQSLTLGLSGKGHARAVAVLFPVQEDGMTLAELERKGLAADEVEELHRARRGLDAYDPHHSRDVERAYRAGRSGTR